MEEMGGGEIKSDALPKDWKNVPRPSTLWGWGSGRSGQPGALQHLEPGPLGSWHCAHGTCRACSQFVFIFRHICKCSLKNTSPHKTRAISP